MYKRQLSERPAEQITQCGGLLRRQSALGKKIDLLCADIEQIHRAELIRACELFDEKRGVALFGRNTDAEVMFVDGDEVFAPESCLRRGEKMLDSLFRAREEEKSPNQVGERQKKDQIIDRPESECAADGLEYGIAEH